MSNVLKFKKPFDDRPYIKLTTAERLCWDILEDDDHSAKRIAGRNGVSQQTVRNIKTLRTDRAAKVAEIMVRVGYDPLYWEKATRFSDDQVAAIRASDKKSNVLAKMYGCSPSTIRMLKTGKTYAARGKPKTA